MSNLYRKRLHYFFLSKLAVQLAERLGVDPVAAVIDQYRRDGGDSADLTDALSDMR